MFTVAFRDRVRDRILALARDDERVVAGAVVGGLAHGGGDELSDLDLTFGVAGDDVTGALEDWTRVLQAELDGVQLFDLPARTSIYRVFLLPGALQVDLSFTPAADFAAHGPQFELLFGEAADRSSPDGASASDLFGRGVHHAVRARYCIERGRFWQAEHWLSGVRDETIALVCLRHGVETSYARGAHRVPAGELALLEGSLARSLDRDELLRALRAAVDGLLREGDERAELVEPWLCDLLPG